MKKLLAVSGVVIVVLAIFLWTFLARTQQQTDTPSLIDSTTLDTLTAKDASNIDTSRLATNVVAPTNKWFSGIALQKEPKAVFPSPLSFLPTDTSFEIGLPKVATTAKTIMGAHVPNIHVLIAGASSYSVTRYDELSVDLTYESASEKLGTVTLTAGSPFIFFTAARDTTLTAPIVTPSTTVDNRVTLAGDTSTTTIAGYDGTVVDTNNTTLTARVPAGGFMTLYSIPAETPDTLLPFAGNRVTGASVAHREQGESYQTAITLKTANNKPSAFGFLPHQRAENQTSQLSYDTIYGKSKIAIDSSFRFTTKTIETIPSLPLENLSDSDKQLLITTLRRDINATIFTAEDTYFGGKSLYRAAQLLDMAHQLHQDEIAASIQQKLRRELDTWLSTSPRSVKSFYYDTRVRGIVGQTPAFGSEDFNDHHFHYGYFIYAASILAKYDSEFLEQNKAIVDLLVADIANYKTDEKLPLRRSFDPYFGHSWASGSSPFADGNNQESSSEAINAWIGVSLWAKQTDNHTLLHEAKWMLSNEAASAAAYWLAFDKTAQPYASGYKPSLVSLNWGGKRDYATFFSAEPSALLGILLIPMSPSTVYQTAYGDKITQQVQESLSTFDGTAQFTDYILMYSALHTPEGRFEKARSLPDTAIDGANSRSYMYAWLMALQQTHPR